MYSDSLRATIFQRFSHSARFRAAQDEFCRSVKDGASVLDFGTGDGRIFEYYLERNKTCRYYGYDISKKMLSQASDHVKKNVILTDNIDDLSSHKFDYISCLETLEHIPDDVVPGVIRRMKSLLSPNEVLLISVPIESGPPSLFKQIIRMMAGQRERIATIPAILMSSVYLTGRVKRDQKDPGHTGFDFIRLRKIISSSGLRVLKTKYSPFSFGWFFVNSQVFYIAERAKEAESLKNTL